jgi:cytochrome c peroxidase
MSDRPAPSPVRLRWLLLSLGACTGSTGQAPPAALAGPTPHTVTLPAGIAPMPLPDDNPLTVEGVELGRFLFYDPLLSGNNTQSCASCHQQARAFTDGKARAVGAHGNEVRRNSMQLANLAWEPSFFWDGRAESLEALVPQPIQDPTEMAQEMPALLDELRRHPDYPARFEAAFPGQALDEALIAKAIAQFLRTLVSFGSFMDRFASSKHELTDPQRRGMELLSSPMPLGAQDGRKDVCNGCHEFQRGLLTEDGAGLYTNAKARNNGLAPDPADQGIFERSGAPDDLGRFKVPTIRNVGYTAPYMHDGRFATLDEVVGHYNEAVRDLPTVDEFLRYQGAPVRLGLDEAQVADIVAALALFDDPGFIANPAFSDPFAAP